MNDPKLARERSRAVRRAKENGVDKEDAFRHIRDKYGKFEGHMLSNTIDRIYGEEDE